MSRVIRIQQAEQEVDRAAGKALPCSPDIAQDLPDLALGGNCKCRPDDANDLPVADQKLRPCDIGCEPSGEAVAAGMRPAEIRRAHVVAALDAREVLLHIVRAPTRVAGQRGDVVPVGVVRCDCDKRMMAVQPPSVPERGYQRPNSPLKSLALASRRSWTGSS